MPVAYYVLTYNKTEPPAYVRRLAQSGRSSRRVKRGADSAELNNLAKLLEIQGEALGTGREAYCM